tara:strand:+ start:232 stop:627 length:396 start_codon:yes stop_codon:yes gene_type:complete
MTGHDGRMPAIRRHPPPGADALRPAPAEIDPLSFVVIPARFETPPPFPNVVIPAKAGIPRSGCGAGIPVFAVMTFGNEQGPSLTDAAPAFAVYPRHRRQDTGSRAAESPFRGMLQKKHIPVAKLHRRARYN